MTLVYKILPSFIIYTDKLIKETYMGQVYGIFIIIRPSQKNNECLLRHELVHVKQFYRTFGLHGLMYNLSKRYRLKCEVEAYRETIKCKGYTRKDQSEWIVDFLYKNYNLNMTKGYIRTKLHT